MNVEEEISEIREKVPGDRLDVQNSKINCIILLGTEVKKKKLSCKKHNRRIQRQENRAVEEGFTVEGSTKR